MKLKYHTIPTAVFFILTAALIAYFFPREGKFRYQFYEGKPWRYELLTASSDFPIYKTDEEIKAQKDSVLKTFEPYYRKDPSVANTETGKLKAAFRSDANNQLPTLYQQYLEHSLAQVYHDGILAHDRLEDLRRNNQTQIKLLENNVAQSRHTANLFTVRTAYEYILNQAPSYLDIDSLRACNIDRYLTENLSYDEETSNKVKEDLLQSLPIASGMVQAGERIADRGEIIDNHTYNVLRSLKIIHESRSAGNQKQGIILGSQTMLVFGIILCFWLYLRTFRLQRILYSHKNTLFLLLCILTGCILTELCVRYHLFNIYILPYAIIPIVVRTFVDSRTALFTHLTVVLLCSLMAPYPHEFLVLQTIAGMVVIFSLRDLSERSQLIRCAFFIYLAYALCYVSLAVYMEADLNKVNWLMLLYFGINFILLMFTYILVYMLERTFGYVSSITLIELSNINKPLLKKLSEVAPGTFQHSMQVSILASAATEKIGGNASLVRTGALYHDIGKMANPAFFTENQTNINPHDQITFEQSAQIIIGHITEGIRMADKASLPQAITDFIRTHHGRGKAKYFYTMFHNKYPDREIDEDLFTYPGPNPFSKETAILMMADSVEAASRSLHSHTEEEIRNLVNKIIDAQLADGLHKDAPLTFRDVEEIKNIFIDKLKIMYHTRISYPEKSSPK
ncbi:MAG: HDIG domain-containing protein [Tannerellaceae bacterium]|jgi:putative nucleotidyltransferase with HDIG domain|nr:HDIG domain-containing protein [Tannerellaceae bacterium]